MADAAKRDQKILKQLDKQRGESHEVIKIPDHYDRRKGRAIGDALIAYAGGSEKHGGPVKNKRSFIGLDDPNREELMQLAHVEALRHIDALQLGDPVEQTEEAIEARTGNKYKNSKRRTGRPVGRPLGSGKRA
ncbi:MAG: hypothetical protein AAFY88_18045, partial [Acidobacteriota bacterium]